MTDPTRAALVAGLDGVLTEDNGWSLLWGHTDPIGDNDEWPIADAILAQPAMARIKAVVDAAVAWRDMPRDGYLRAAVDALLAEDSDVAE